MNSCCFRYAFAVALVAGLAACSQPIGNAPDATSSSESTPSQGPVATPAKTYEVEGVYVEACSCLGTCQAEVTGAATGCDALGAAEITKGKSDGYDISGSRLAFAVDHADQLHLYLDAPDIATRLALECFARAAFAGFGKVQSVASAHIELAGTGGAYTVKVQGGRVMSLSTEPVLGGDHKTPVALNNSMHPLNPTLFQGTCAGATYADGSHAFTIASGRNSFFNQHMKAHKAQ